jgi:DNA topoisomerase-1
MEKYNNEQYIGLLKPISGEHAHEPIRPTNIKINKIPSSYTGKEHKIYNIIWGISLESCMSDSIYDSMDVSITAPNDFIYKKNIKKIIFDGWEKIKENKIDNKEYEYLLRLKNTIIIENKKINSISSMIGNESHYTESSLIKKIEQLGFGRPSTYSSLVEKIKERKYVLLKDIVLEEDKIMYELEENNISKSIDKIEKVEKNKLIIQPLGINVIEYIYSHFSTLFNYEYTTHMEDKLDEIMKGTNTVKNICDEIYQQLKTQSLTKEENNIIRIIDRETSIRKSKIGEYIYYKKEKMKKPIFISLESFEEDYQSCSNERILEWVKIKLLL